MAFIVWAWDADGASAFIDFVLSKVTPTLVTDLGYKIFLMFAAINIGGMATFSLCVLPFLFFLRGPRLMVCGQAHPRDQGPLSGGDGHHLRRGFCGQAPGGHRQAGAGYVLVHFPPVPAGFEARLLTFCLHTLLQYLTTIGTKRSPTARSSTKSNVFVR